MADVGIAQGRIRAVGRIDGPSRRVIDAGGLVVAPGFIDPHCHYDAQLFWDPSATPSCFHGVTTVVAGNCGFSLAPLRPPFADYLRRMMVRVEGMPLVALEAGVPWDWAGFPAYLDALDGHLGVNAGFMVGHSALRLCAMGERAVGAQATDDDLRNMVALAGEALAAGALGLSTSRASTHSDGDGQPVASRWASEDELLELCAVVGRYDGTCLEAIVEGCLAADGFDDHDAASSSPRAGRPGWASGSGRSRCRWTRFRPRASSITARCRCCPAGRRSSGSPLPSGWSSSVTRRCGRGCMRRRAAHRRACWPGTRRSTAW
jgi:hypothetical protein